MDSACLHQYLDDPSAASEWLQSLGLVDLQRGHANLERMATRGITLDLLATMCGQFSDHLPHLSDPDMALNNLERFVEAARNPLSLGALFERDPESLPTLLQIFSTSQYLSDLLVRDHESYDLLRVTEGAPVARQELIDDLTSEIDLLEDESAVMKTLRRFKHRETLRIAYGDIVRGLSLEIVIRQISFLADALCEAALRAAWKKVAAKRGEPRGPDSQRAKLVILALGKLGGVELNYSSDIDLVLLYDVEGQTDGVRSLSNSEFFERVARQMSKLLSEPTELGSVYRVDLRLRPNGAQGPIARSLTAMLQYYDVSGRTWERQAYVKARPIAGDLKLGHHFLDHLQPWIYRRYLSLTDITGIKALKRRIEQKTGKGSSEEQNVKIGHGGIRDIEFVIQFLQLLNGGSLPQIRTGNTLDAIAALEQNGCLTFQEREILEENYRFLRKIEHRLQIMFDLQTHVMPVSQDERRKLAIRMGFQGTPNGSALKAFELELKNKTELNRKILDHLLHDAFGDEAETEPEVDLVNDPDPPRERIHEILGRYPFQDIDAAYQNLMALATEKIRFLSTRRCRHFLAAIAPRLLSVIAETPDPDATLMSLSQVSDSLGGKAVLWELFSFHPPSLNLYVRLCSASPYLASILTSNPGMIDELTDSLRLQRLPTLEMLETTLADLCRAAEDLDPILHSFKDAQHLRVGVRDILGKDDIVETHAAISDISEAVLKRITAVEFEKLTEKYGRPTIGPGDEEQPNPRSGEPSEMIILALGKLGGREPNYHSDQDIVFLYEADGNTRHDPRSQRKKTTSNQHFFSELGQRIIKVANRLSPYGRLFEIDPRLRPTGRSGSLVVPLSEFSRYFAEGAGQLWERQALCKGRVIFGSARAAEKTMAAVWQATYEKDWQATDAEEIYQMRHRLEESAGKRNLKRGRGGTVDIEFVVQMLQLRHGGSHPEVRQTGTLSALDALASSGFLSDDDYAHFTRSYRYLRSVESHIRLMDSAGRHELPDDEMELRKLAYLLRVSDGRAIAQETEKMTTGNRERFERIFRKAMTR